MKKKKIKKEIKELKKDIEELDYIIACDELKFEEQQKGIFYTLENMKGEQVMDLKRAKEIMKNEQISYILQRKQDEYYNEKCDENCRNCDLVQADKEVLDAYELAIELLDALDKVISK